MHLVGCTILYIKMNVCMFVCMYLIHIHISDPIWTKLCTRLPLGLEETVGYVWTRDSWPLRPFGSFFFGGHCRIMGTRWLPARPFSAITLYPWLQLVFACRHRHYVVADGGVIRGSLISVILAGVPLTSQKWRRSRRGHTPQRYISHSSFRLWPTGNHILADDSCAFLLQVSVMRTIRWDVNGIHGPTIRNLIRREGS